MPAAPSRGGRGMWLLGAAILVIAAVLAGWALQIRYAGGAGSLEDAPASPYAITVMDNGRTLRKYDLAALQALPQTRVVIDGKAQTGPALATLLTDAGAAKYDSVVVRGAGIRDDGSLTLTAAQVGRRVQLDFSDRGTIKVCGPNLTHADWVRDVLTIDAH